MLYIKYTRLNTYGAERAECAECAETMQSTTIKAADSLKEPSAAFMGKT